MSSFAQYGPGKEELPVNISRGTLRRNSANDGWEEKTPENLLADAASSINFNGQKGTNVGAPTPGSTDIANAQYADSVGVDSVLTAAYLLLSDSFTTAVTQPQSLTDALMIGYVPDGSIAGSGQLGVISVTLTNIGDETGVGPGQGGLGTAPNAAQPYNSADFPGQHDVHTKIIKIDGTPLILSDILSSAIPPNATQPIECYLSYRSDLGANAKWRLWFYYRRVSDGLHVTVTPDTVVTNCDLFVPNVTTLGTLPVGAMLGQVQAAAAIAGILPGVVSDIQPIGTAAVAGTSGRFADAQHAHNHGQQAAGSNGGLAHALAVAGVSNGFLSSGDKTKLDGLPSSAVASARNITSGAGLTGGGDLSADRTLVVGANADGSITVNADDIQVGVLATDAQHGSRGGGTQHSVATTGTAGFMSATDKTKLDNISGDAFNVTAQTLNATPFDIASYTPADNKAITVQSSIVARRSDGAAGSTYRLFGGFRRSGGTVTQIGTTKIIAFVQDTGFNTDATFSVSGTTISVRVTGLLATIIDWRAQGDIKIVP